MQKITYRLLAAAVAGSLLVVIYLGYRVLNLDAENRKFQTNQFSAFEKRMAALEKRMEAFEAVPDRVEPSSHAAGGSAATRSAPASSEDNAEVAVIANSVELARIKEIMAATGLEQLAAEENFDPDLLSSMYSEYAERSRVSKYRQSMMATNEFQHQQDEDLFDEYLNELYNRARPRRGAGVDKADSEAAFAEMLDKYPDAYATAMVISERAFAAIWSRDQAGVEKYYQMLQESDSEIAGTVVTDRGIEALPNIELYLVRQYLRNGREEEAVVLMQSLENNYAESLVFSGGSGRGRRWMTVSEALDLFNTTR